MTGFLAKTGALMAAVGPPRRWRAMIASAMLAVVALVGHGTVASASCGDWLADPSHSMAVAIPTSQEPADIPERLADRAGGPAPCHGPLCRQAPDQPAPPLPATISVRIDKLGIAAPPAVDDPEARQFGLSPESEAHSARGFPLRVEHPPRV